MNRPILPWNLSHQNNLIRITSLPAKNWPLLPDPLRKEFITSYLKKIRQCLQTLPESPDRLMPTFRIHQPTRDSRWLLFPRPQGTDFRMTSEPLRPLLEQLQRALFRCEQRDSNLHRGFLRGNSWLLEQCTQETIYIYINVVLCLSSYAWCDYLQCRMF